MKHLMWIGLLVVPALCYGDTSQSLFTVSVKVVASPTSGRLLYDTQCVACHSFSDMQNTSEQKIREVISRDDHKMTLSNKQVQDIAAFLQTYY